MFKSAVRMFDDGSGKVEVCERCRGSGLAGKCHVCSGSGYPTWSKEHHEFTINTGVRNDR